MKGVALIEEHLRDDIMRLQRLSESGRLGPLSNSPAQWCRVGLMLSMRKCLELCEQLKQFEVGRDHDTSTNETVIGDIVNDIADDDSICAAPGTELPESEKLHYLEARDWGSIPEGASVRKSRFGKDS